MPSVVTPASSHKQINKAASYVAEMRRALLAGEVDLDRISAAESQRIVRCAEIIEKWREKHAGPLRNANANLRHYVRPYAARDQNVSVTQRLKKFSTILDKLGRYSSMQLTRMEDIGGVRAILPSQEAADDVSRRLRKNWKVHRYRDYVREPKDSGYRALHLMSSSRASRSRCSYAPICRTSGRTRLSETPATCGSTTSPGAVRRLSMRTM